MGCAGRWQVGIVANVAQGWRSRAKQRPAAAGPADFRGSIEEAIPGQEQLAGRELPRRRSVQPDECLPDLPLRGGGEQQEHEESDPGFQPVSEPHTGWKPVPHSSHQPTKPETNFHSSLKTTPRTPPTESARRW